MHRDSLRVLAIVVSHLRSLRDEWNASATDELLTRSLNSLRILLVDQQYCRAWQIAGFPKQPEIPATSGGQGEGIVTSQAGGGEFSNITLVQSTTMFNRAMSDEEVKERFAQFKAQSLAPLLPLSAYVKSTCIIHSGQRISRGELIKYVANKLGGTHIDQKDRPKDAAKFAALDNLMATWRLADKRGPYYELLSIGQAVGRSRDADRLLRKSFELGAEV